MAFALGAVTYFMPYEKRPVITVRTQDLELAPADPWCKLVFRGRTFYVHESLEDDYEYNDLAWVMTCADTGCHVYFNKFQDRPAECLENGLKKLKEHWPEYLRRRIEIEHRITHHIPVGLLTALLL